MSRSKILALLLFASSTACAQLWTGILDPARAISWAGAGGGIIARSTPCAIQPVLVAGSANATANSTSMNNAITAASGGNCVINYPAGTFYFSQGWQGYNTHDYTIRAAGANLSFAIFLGTGAQGLFYVSNNDTNFSGSTYTNANSFSWTAAAYTKGQDTITASTHNNLFVGSNTILDQLDDAADTGNLYVSQDAAHAYDGGGSGIGRPGAGTCNSAGNPGAGCRAQMQNVQVVSCGTSIPGAACTSNTIVFSPGLYSSNWSAGKSPQAWYSTLLPAANVGIEDITLDGRGSGGAPWGIRFHNVTNSWVKGVRILSANGAGSLGIHVQLYQSTHCTVRDSYFYGSGGASQSYGVDSSYGSADNLIENNIFQHISTATIREGDAGSVFAYNYAVDNFYTPGGTFQQGDAYVHGVGHMGLWEGNIGSEMELDNIHGTNFLHTAFRNVFSGFDTGIESGTKTGPLVAMQIYAFSRYNNIVGNALGTPGKTTTYKTIAQTTTDNSSTGNNSAIVLGYSFPGGQHTGCCINDLTTATSTMLWGNWDNVNSAVRFNTTEDGHTAPTYPAITNASQTFPSSFYLSAKPPFWNTGVYPPIGPDVSNGNIANTGGHANLNPAANCYLNVMGGLTDGSSGPLTFNPTACYYISPPPPPVTKIVVTGSLRTFGNITLGGVVGGATLVSIDVVPPSASIPVGTSISFSALGTFSDGSTSDVTSQAIWQVAPPGIASNSDETVSCTAGGIVTVSAQVTLITGTATLTCQRYQIVPSGNLTAFLNTPYSQQFTELGGVGPYTWSFGTLPPGLLSNSSGLISGTPSALGNYIFTVSDTDSSDPPVTDNTPVTIHVLAQQTEDNRYCNPNETITGLSADGPAQPMQNCNYTAIAGTPSPGTTLFVCPTGQTDVFGNPDPNCNPSATPPYYNSVQAAMNAATCGQTIKLYEIRGTATQNIYNENLVLPPSNCFGSGKWITVETRAIASLPAPGTRITPAWFGQASIPGRPAYQQPSTPGIYGPMIRCVGGNAPTKPCEALAMFASSGSASAWRFIGIEFTAPHGREPAGGSPQGFPSNVDVCPTNLNGTPQCDPGFVSPIVSLGCSSPSQCGVSGASHIILDRVWIHGCDDKSSIGCKGQSREGIELEGGRHNSVIDSYINDFKTMIGVGPSVEAHGIGGGNVKNTGDDIATKIVNNFLESSSVDFFQGGGGSTTGVYTYDIEVRRNTLFKPLLWKIDDPSFPLMGGSVYDAWVKTPGATYANDPGTTCTLTAPTGPNPVQATCTAHVAGGQLLDVTITNPGSGYTDNPKFSFSGGNGKAVAFPLIGTYNVKNHVEFKNGRRVLIEGNRMANVWKGQSDQDANALLLTPKNAGDCLTCTVQDVTIRYNISQGSNRAVNVGAVVDTRCGVNQTSNITSISESGNTVTVVVADVIVSKIQIGATVDIAGVPTDVAYNGTFTITTINNAGKTFTYTNPTAGLGSRTGGTAAFTPPVCLSDGLFRASIHDDLFDGVNPILWLSKKQAFDGYGGTCFSLGNGNPQESIAQDVEFNHVGCITTSPSGAGSSSLAATLILAEGCQNSTAVYPGLKFRNSYGAGGVKAPGTIGQGCPNCSGPNCTGGSTTALSMMAVSDHLLPVSGGFYTTGQVMRGVVDAGGVCTVAPTSVTFTGGGFTVQATGGLVFQNGTVTAVTVKTVGAGYTSAPTVVFNGGTCSVAPTGHTVLGGKTGVASTKSWCFNNNIIPQAVYNGENPMTPYPTTQGDPTNNTCSSHGGGGNVAINTWQDMLFTNLPIDSAGSEIPTGDLRLQGGSPGKNAGDDGLDIGPNIDLINQYTGCSIVNGVTVCP